MKGGEQVPATELIASSPAFHVSASTWKPEPQTISLAMQQAQLLQPHTHYWLVLTSRDMAGKNGVWLLGRQTAISSTSLGGGWQPVDSPSAAPGMTLLGNITF